MRLEISLPSLLPIGVRGCVIPRRELDEKLLFGEAVPLRVRCVGSLPPLPLDPGQSSNETIVPLPSPVVLGASSSSKRTMAVVVPRLVIGLSTMVPRHAIASFAKPERWREVPFT